MSSSASEAGAIAVSTSGVADVEVGEEIELQHQTEQLGRAVDAPELQHLDAAEEPSALQDAKGLRELRVVAANSDHDPPRLRVVEAWQLKLEQLDPAPELERRPLFERGAVEGQLVAALPAQPVEVSTGDLERLEVAGGLLVVGRPGLVGDLQFEREQPVVPPLQHQRRQVVRRQLRERGTAGLLGHRRRRLRRRLVFRLAATAGSGDQRGYQGEQQGRAYERHLASSAVSRSAHTFLTIIGLLRSFGSGGAELRAS